MKKINDYLEKHFGIRINRSRALPKTDSSREENLIIEFIGTPGVGKSTLIRHFFKNFNSVYTNQLINLEKESKYFNTSTIELKDLYDQLLKQKIIEVSKTKHCGEVQLHLIKNAKNSLVRDVIAHEYFSNKIVFIDEGMLISTSDILYTYCEADLKEYIKGRLVIFCDTDEEIISKQLINRKAKTNNLDLKEEHYRNMVSRSKKKLNQFHKKLEEINVPTLKLDTQDDPQENSQQINDFIYKHLKKRGMNT